MEFLKKIDRFCYSEQKWISNVFRNIQYGIKNLILWAPVIWSDRNWDDLFIYRIFRKKLLLQAKHFKKYGHHVSRERDAKNMMICVYCLDRLIDTDLYHDMAFKRHYEKWGEPNFTFRDINGGFSQLVVTYPGMTEKDMDQERKEFKRATEHKVMLQKQDLNYLTLMIKKHIFTWWD